MSSLRSRGQQRHRGAGGSRIVAECATYLGARQAGHHPIEHDQIGRICEGGGEAGLAIGPLRHAVAVVGQLHGQQRADVGVVVDDHH